MFAWFNRGMRCAAHLGITVFLLAGCAASNTAETIPAWASGNDASRSADSMTAYIDDMLSDEMDQSQRRMLEQAKDNDGIISKANYLSAWNNYRQCIVDKGYTAPPLLQINGIYVRQHAFDTEGMSPSESMKFDTDVEACRNSYVLYVDTVYRDNQGNPELYTDPDVSLVHCLRQHQLVPESYTVSEFMHESDARLDVQTNSGSDDFQQALENSFTFDFDDPKVMTCIVATNPSLVNHRLDTWHPLG